MTGRPGDWSPLRATDPVPGDPSVVEAEAGHHRDLAEELRAQATRLRRIADEDTLVGQSADALRAAAGDLGDDLQRVERRAGQVATALASWAGALRSAQDRADALLLAARAAEDEARALRVAPPLSAEATPAEIAAERARIVRLQEAEAEVRRLERRLDEVEADRDADARDTARRLRAAADDGLRDSRWDDLRGTASRAWSAVDGFVTRHAAVLKRVAEVLGHVALAFAVLALCFTGVGVFALLAVLATAGALATRLALAGTGNGSWVDVGLEAFALLTFGTGRIATSGLRTAHATAAATARATARATRASTAVRRAQLGRQLARAPRGGGALPARTELRRLQAEAKRMRLLERPRRPEALTPSRVAVVKAGGELANARLWQDMTTLARAIPEVGSLGAGWLRLARVSYGLGIGSDVGDSVVGGSELWRGKPALGSWERFKDGATSR